MSPKALPPIDDEARAWLSYNPNTSDLVEWIENYARKAIAAAEQQEPAQPNAKPFDTEAMRRVACAISPFAGAAILECCDEIDRLRAAPLQREQGEETAVLPPLPKEAVGYMRGCNLDLQHGALLFTAAQMHAYARAALAGVGPNEGSVNQVEAASAPLPLGSDASMWISVAERPIPTEGLVDLFVGGMRRAGCYHDRICDEWRQIERGILISFRRNLITHWMPNPAAPLPLDSLASRGGK